MFQDVNLKSQVHLYLKFDVGVLKHAFFLKIIVIYNHVAFLSVNSEEQLIEIKSSRLML